MSSRAPSKAPSRARSSTRRRSRQLASVALAALALLACGEPSSDCRRTASCPVARDAGLADATDPGLTDPATSTDSNGVGPTDVGTEPDGAVPMTPLDGSVPDAGRDGGDAATLDGGDAATRDASFEPCTDCECDDNYDCFAPYPICDPAERRCIQCIDGTDDYGCSGKTPRCKPGLTLSENRCVQCLSADDCSSDSPACQQDLCVPCSSATHHGCDDPTPRCLAANDVADNSCVACLDNNDCSTETPVCDANACVACVADGDTGCSDQTPRCLVAEAASDNSCVACLDSSDCSDDTPACDHNICSLCSPGDDLGCSAEAPRCLAGQTPQLNLCVQCLDDDDCGSATPVCEDNVCIPCSASPSNPADGTDSGCGGAVPRCLAADSPADNACVQCLDSLDCPDSAPFCEGNLCLGCLLDDDCLHPGAPVCDLDTSTCGACSLNSHCARFTDSPRCNTASSGPSAGQCVQCTQNSHCSDPNASACVDGACVPCDHSASGAPADDNCDHIQGAPACVTGQCLQCSQDAHCSDPNASKCGTSNTCGPCSVDDPDNPASDHCDHIPGASACNPSSGQCVQCTANDRSACGNNVCVTRPSGDGLTQFTCSSNSAASSGSCQPCVSDAQCSPGRRCVQTTFQAQPSGFFCLWKQGAESPAPAECETQGAPYLNPSQTSSVDGEAGTYCRLTFATCQAFSDFADSCTDDDDCGLGIGDGLCRPRASQNQCTYQCASDADCDLGCLIGESPKYCSFTPAQ